MAIVYYRNSKTGRTVAYESKAKWNSELGYSVPERKYLGVVDSEGNIIPSSGRRGRKPRNPDASAHTGEDNQPDLKAEIAELEKELAAVKKENDRLQAKLSAEQEKSAQMSDLISQIHRMTVR